MGVRHKIKVPSLGEAVQTVVVVAWHVSEGDQVAADAPLVTVETDKVDTEVPAPISGTVRELLAPVGAE
ncbi:MAG TPA: biotin/lipoyl-containing protein, partial [Acidimicrobiia bacterium]|nr:biotin/lipoyl-containing protein [Acidimicrobiia bacterium]